MSVWPNPLSAPHCSLLQGVEGELVQVRVTTDPKHLEDLLECLSAVSFPINPQIYHGLPTVVEFPAYQGRLCEVQDALAASGFDSGSMQVNSMLAAISAA